MVASLKGEEMLIDIIRKFVPEKLRQEVGVFLISQASRSWPVLKTYLWVLHGGTLKGLMLDGSHCTFDYEGIKIVAPRNSAGIFLEIFQDEVYEKMWSPKEGDVVVDVGAYVGMFTVKASKLVGDSGKVVAIEPNPKTYVQLAGNTAELNNVILARKAIWTEAGKAKPYYSGTPGGDSILKPRSNYFYVETITLDNLVDELGLTKIDFIKIDAEGAELEALMGAEKTLKGNVKLSIASYHMSSRGEPEQPKVVSFLQERGFAVNTIRGLRGYTYATKNNEAS